METVNPVLIKVRDELPRIRKELGKINELAMSIEKFGQMQPVVVNREMELIAGGRRLAACLILQRDVKICFVDEVEPLRMREMELEENLQRKNLTPAEEVLAVAELHQLKVNLYGEAKPGTKEEGRQEWTQQQTADLLGKSRTSVIEDLLLAEAVKNFPSLSTAKTKSEIKSAVKGLERVSKNIDALAKYEETIKQTKEFVLVNRDAVSHMVGIPDQSVDLVLTDPPYGIDIFEQAITTGGETGGELTTTGVKYEDTEESAKLLLSVLATQSYRFTKPTGHFYSFCAPSHFWWYLEELRRVGWIVRERPIVWIKRESGQNNQPSMWPSSAYEFIIFARKHDSKLAIEGRIDWIQCDPVLPSVRIHQAEKPVSLIKELLSRTCYPGACVYDPFAGSGAIIEAACDMKMLAIGCEKAVESYAGMLARMTKWLEGKK